TFVSTDVERDGDDWAITGDLTIKDVTKPITIDFESTGSAKDPFGSLRIGFEGKAVLSRKDWGLTWNAALETGGMLVSDKIKLEFDISAIQKCSCSELSGDDSACFHRLFAPTRRDVSAFLRRLGVSSLVDGRRVGVIYWGAPLLNRRVKAGPGRTRPARGAQLAPVDPGRRLPGLRGDGDPGAARPRQ